MQNNKIELRNVEDNTIKSKIHTIRGKQVMLDRDLALLYETDTSQLNRAMKRNKDRFPEDFCFQLSSKEFRNLICQFGISNWGGVRKLPYAFTEQGVATLSGILKSNKAIQTNIQIMRAFVAMRHFLIQNATVFQKFQQIDQKLIAHDKSIEQVFRAIEEKHITPKQGIFFNGQVFDAYKFVSDLVRSAKKSIIVIDNYIDQSVLTLLSNKNDGVIVTVHTASVSESLLLAKDKFNKQYGMLEINKFNLSHDRFLIVDDKEIYHIGASLKDLGKKWFAFCKLDIGAHVVLDIIKKTTRLQT